MPFRRSWLTLSILVIAVSPAAAGAWQTQQQASAASQIGSALASANWCNFGVDTSRITAVIEDRIAPVGKLTPQMASELMFTVVGAQAIQSQMLGVDKMNKRDLAKHCSEVISYFGPGGTAIPGLLKP